MKSLVKRISSGLLALFMVLSLLVGIIPADTFAASYTYNTGTRHDYNATLSNQALAYYTGAYTWEKLSALEGGTDNCLDMDNPMFEALHTLMASTMTKSVSYSSLPDYWKYTDASGGSAGTIWFYADHTGSGTMSREHVWPKSHASFEEKNGGADLHHLRPSISNVNSTRGNMIMGNVRHLTGYTSKNYVYYKNNICEVNDNIKGDVARIFLYVWCRWEEPNLFKNTPNPVVGPNDSKNDGGKVIESLETLLQWCEIDPVDTWEMSRNDQVQNIQGNRNVFIDYPEFAWLVFGQDVPAGINTPSDNGGVTANPGGNNTPPVTNPPVTNPPVTQPPVTQPPVTQPPVTQPPVTQPPVSQPSIDASTPLASQPVASEGTQPSTPATKPAQPAPMATAPVNPNDFIQKEEPSSPSVGTIVLIILGILVAGAAIYFVVIYFVVIKPKKNAAPAADAASAEEIAEETPAEESSDDTPTEENE